MTIEVTWFYYSQHEFPWERLLPLSVTYVEAILGEGIVGVPPCSVVGLGGKGVVARAPQDSCGRVSDTFPPQSALLFIFPTSTEHDSESEFRLETVQEQMDDKSYDCDVNFS